MHPCVMTGSSRPFSMMGMMLMDICCTTRSFPVASAFPRTSCKPCGASCMYAQRRYQEQAAQSYLQAAPT